MEITRSSPFKISLSEGAEPRVVEAAVKAVNLGIAKIILRTQTRSFWKEVP